MAPDAPALYSPDGNLNWQLYNGSSTFSNPAGQTLIEFKSATNNLISNLNLSYQLLPGLVLKSAFGYNRDEMTQNQITPSTSAEPPLNTQNDARSIVFANTTFNSWIIEPQLDYDRKFAWGKIDALFGGTFQGKMQNSQTQFFYGFSSDALITDLAAASNQYFLGSNYTLYHYTALYGRLGYNWEDTISH